MKPPWSWSWTPSTTVTDEGGAVGLVAVEHQTDSNRIEAETRSNYSRETGRGCEVMSLYRSQQEVMSLYRSQQEVMSLYRRQQEVMSLYRSQQEVMSLYRSQQEVMSRYRRQQEVICRRGGRRLRGGREVHVMSWCSDPRPGSWVMGYGLHSEPQAVALSRPSGRPSPGPQTLTGPPDRVPSHGPPQGTTWRALLCATAPWRPAEQLHPRSSGGSRRLLPRPLQPNTAPVPGGQPPRPLPGNRYGDTPDFTDLPPRKTPPGGGREREGREEEKKRERERDRESINHPAAATR
ncbi:hypothetical protein EYF80_056672 [Liparis tanakae]|uniref:Uncharacterized protein n=1 Tax=Liparis tanakae TaxID=230148 RepID=A0A4Z2EX58_9TELE|nr:hypothetical protein EYF80_056672 [Liparis tanakae]